MWDAACTMNNAGCNFCKLYVYMFVPSSVHAISHVWDAHCHTAKTWQILQHVVQLILPHDGHHWKPDGANKCCCHSRPAANMESHSLHIECLQVYNIG